MASKHRVSNGVGPLGASSRRAMLRMGLGGAALAAGARSSRAAMPLILRFAAATGAKAPNGAAAVAFAAEVARLSAGHLLIDVFLDAALGGEAESLEALRTGELDLCSAGTVSCNTIEPRFGLFDVPFLFRDVAHARAVMASDFFRPYLDFMKPAGITGLGWFELGMRQLTNARHPVRVPEDLRGLKLRVPQSPVAMEGFRALGADPRAMPFPMLYGALETGALDGQENPIATINDTRLYRVQKYLTLSSHIYGPAGIFASSAALAELGDAERGVLAAAAPAAAAAARDISDAANSAGLDALRREGMEVVESIDRAAFVAASSSAREKFRAQFGAAAFERIDAL